MAESNPAGEVTFSEVAAIAIRRHEERKEPDYIEVAAGRYDIMPSRIISALRALQSSEIGADAYERDGAVRRALRTWGSLPVERDAVSYVLLHTFVYYTPNTRGEGMRYEANARRHKPKPSAGYSYEAEAVDAPSEDWDTVVYTPTGREAFVGTRTIDGEMMNVWQVPAGVRPGRPYSHHIAQSPQMSRNARGAPIEPGVEPGDYIVTELEHPGWWSFFIIDSRGFPKEIGPNMMRSFDDALEVVRLHAREEGQEHAVIFHEKALHDLRQVGNYVRGRGIQFGGGVPYSPNAAEPPPPPRRRRVADPSLRRVRQIVEREERPFEPERRYPRETKPHHFVVNAGLEQWREPDDSSDFSAVWYGPGGRDEAEQATEIDDAPGGWYVREYQHLAGYVDDFDPDEPFLVTETFVDLGETLQALSDAGLTEPAYRVELMRYAVAFGVADLAERGGDESYASELP